MRMIANCLATTSLVLVTALAAARRGPPISMPPRPSMPSPSIPMAPASPASSRSICRPATTRLVAEGFSADARSVVAAGRGRGGRKTHDRRDRCPAATPAPPVNLSELDKRIEALKDERANLQGAIASAKRGANSPSVLPRPRRPDWAKRARRGRSPNGVRPLRRSPRKSRPPIPRSATPNASSATSTARSRGWNPTGRKPPSKLEVRIDLAAAAATKATLRVTYAVRNARWTPLYDARLDTGAKDRKPALELVRRAEITQSTGEDWSNVTLGVSTVRAARGGSAPELGSLIVQYPQAPRPARAGRESFRGHAPDAPLRAGAESRRCARPGGRGAAGRRRSRRFPGDVQDSRPRQRRRKRRRQEPCASRPRRSRPIWSCAPRR